MPFTLAHPAIILPFARLKKIPLSALVVGSVTPDFEYFIKMKLSGRYSHTLEGMFLMDLPLALILWLIFHQIVKRPLIKNLPQYFKSRLLDLKKFEFIMAMKLNFIFILFGLLIGISSHIIWDSFTHGNSILVFKWEWLAKPILGDLPTFPTFRVLQHISTLIGVVVLAFYFNRMPQQTTKSTLKPGFWLGFLIIMLAIIGIRASFGFEYFGDVITSVISACCIGIIISSIIYQLRNE